MTWRLAATNVTMSTETHIVVEIPGHTIAVFRWISGQAHHDEHPEFLKDVLDGLDPFGADLGAPRAR